MSEQIQHIDYEYIAGNTQHEVKRWLEWDIENPHIREQAEFVLAVADRWRAGEINSTQGLELLHHQLVHTERHVSEATSAFLEQAKMWFGFEAQIPLEELEKYDI